MRGDELDVGRDLLQRHELPRREEIPVVDRDPAIPTVADQGPEVLREQTGVRRVGEHRDLLRPRDVPGLIGADHRLALGRDQDDAGAEHVIAAFTHVLHAGESDEVVREVPDVRGDLGGGVRDQRVEPSLHERGPHAVMPARQLLAQDRHGLPPLAHAVASILARRHNRCRGTALPRLPRSPSCIL